LVAVVAFRAIEEFLGARTALGLEVGITAIPLERRGVGYVFEQAVIDDVLAEAIRLQIPL